MRKRYRNTWFFAYLVIVTVVAAELVLRVYNPFPTGIKGDKIVLRVNVKYKIHDSGIPVLEKDIVHSKNSLGFRGPEPPKDIEKYFTIFTVGGSTTENGLLQDGKTWTDGLRRKLDSSFTQPLWLNNAGFASHSSFGHLVLLQDYLVKLKPDMIVMLVGCNDVNRKDLTASDRYIMKGTYGSVSSFFTKNSELANVIATYVRAGRAQSFGLTDRYLDLAHTQNDTLFIKQSEMESRMAALAPLLQEYRNRLNAIAELCRKNKIDLVLANQPTLLGVGVDSITGADLAKHRVADDMNGELWWKTLSLYNEVTRDVAGRNGLFFIDLAGQMPRSSRYYYDMLHFTNEGAEKISQIIHKELLAYLISKHKLS